MSVTLRALTVALLAIAGTLALVTHSGADERFAPSFDAAFTQPAPQSPTGLTLRFGLERGYQFSTVVLYIPRDWGVVAWGEEIPVGTKVATVEANEAFGLINAPCNTVIPIEFQMLNATLDSTNTVSFDDLEMKAGLDPSNEWLGIRDFFEDRDGNTLVAAIDRYPEFLTTAFGDTQPLTRLAGVTLIAGLPVLLQLLIFAPDTRLALPDGAITDLLAQVPQSGYPMLMVMQDLHNPDGVNDPGPITDYCAPREMTLIFSPPESGPPLFVNPQAGSYGFTLLALSKRDADGDGYENSLDTCPAVANTGDPTIPNDGDFDGDGLDAACDPNDNDDPYDGNCCGGSLDEDVDGYLNRQDNCPLAPNGQQIVSRGIWIDSPGNQADQDFDDIGDVCDPNPESPDGEAIVSVKSSQVVVGDASGSGGPPNVAACAHCYRPGGTQPEAETEGAGNTLAVAIGLIGVGAGASSGGGGRQYAVRAPPASQLTRYPNSARVG